MPTAPPTHPPTTAGSQVELVFALEIDPESPTALLRVVALLHRRRCQSGQRTVRCSIVGAAKLSGSCRSSRPPRRPANSH